MARGALLLSLHEFGQARELVEPITGQDLFNSDALAVLVDADVELGRYDDAATNLQHLLDLRPGLPAYSRASYLRELHGDLAGAEEAMHQALTAGAGDRFDVATVTTFLGDLAFGSGDVSGAAAHYREALRLRPDHVNATLGEARVLAARGERDPRDQRAARPHRAGAAPGGSDPARRLAARGRARRQTPARSFDLVRSIVRLQQASGAVTDLETALFEADHGDPGRALAGGAGRLRGPARQRLHGRRAGVVPGAVR